MRPAHLVLKVMLSCFCQHLEKSICCSFILDNFSTDKSLLPTLTQSLMEYSHLDNFLWAIPTLTIPSLDDSQLGQHPLRQCPPALNLNLTLSLKEFVPVGGVIPGVIPCTQNCLGVHFQGEGWPRGNCPGGKFQSGSSI